MKYLKKCCEYKYYYNLYSMRQITYINYLRLVYKNEILKNVKI